MSETHFAMQKIAWLGGEHDFCLTYQHATMLEEKIGIGIMELCSRLNSDFWRASDVRETIRLGLIGGGSDAAQAAALVQRYVDGNPSGIAPSVILASAIVNAVIFGISKPEQSTEGANDPAPPEAPAAPAGV